MSYQGKATGAEPGWLKSIQHILSSSWVLLLSVFAGLCLLILLFAGILFFLTYSFSTAPPGSLTVSSISSPTQIGWSEDGQATITAGDMESAITALGVAHASQNSWQMVLWRQTATGSLSQWFGANLLHIDQFSRRLRMKTLAQQTYDHLPTDQQRLLQAYSQGVNSVLLDKQNISQDEFALLDITPARWEPWHSLAIERLFAWLSVTLPEPDSLIQHMPESYWSVIQSSDLDLRLLLQVHSFDHSLAGIWPADTTGGTTIYHRLVYGSSAIPVFQEVSLQISNDKIVHTASIPGTLSFYSGNAESRSWMLLPSSSIEINPFSLENNTSISHDRIVSDDNTEYLITLYSSPTWLLPEQETLQDSLPVLSWKGLQTGTDLQAFIDLLRGAPPSFHLLDGNGLLTQESSWTLMGTPPEVHRIGEGVMIGDKEWVYYQKMRLEQILVSPTSASPSNWSSDCINTWAEEKATFLVNDYLLRRSPFINPIYVDALTYLRNWNFSYDKSSIGATIFDTWLNTLPDSLYQQVVSRELNASNPLPAALWRQSIDTLVVNFGPDLSKWRLEDTIPVQRWYPAWSNQPQLDHPKMYLANTLFAPLNFPGQGQAATLCWGSLVSEQGLPVSTRWDSWAVVSPSSYTYFWRNHQVPHSMIERYRITNTPSSIFTFSEEENYESITNLSGGAND